MKKIFAVGVAAMLALSLAACGGSSSDTDATTPETSATAAGTSYQLMSGTSELLGPLFAALATPSAQVVKADMTASCNTTGTDTYNCTILDGLGGSATLTGTFVTDTDYSLNFLATFDNFKPSAEITADGSFTWVVSVDSAAFGGYSSIKDNMTKVDTGKENSCEYSTDNIDGEGYCVESDSVCSANSANRLMSFTYTIGADGFTYTDVCGTFVYGAGSAMSLEYCSDDIETTALFTGTIDGSFNNETVDESFNALCDWSALQ